MTDEALIQDYARHQTERAFAALVQRHLDLVYSVARRHVRSSALAEEVAQLVFLELARQAAHLPADTPLVAWLHVVARRTAIDFVRREARRRLREQSATEIQSAMDTPSADWTHIEPLLDEAVESLPLPDRTAVLLRFFENKSYREIGATLGLSDDTAQKRVSRALDRLRVFFAGRGVPVGSAALAVEISTHAAEAAPAGLAGAISSLAISSGAAVSSTAFHATRELSFALLKKPILAVVAVGLVGALVFEAPRIFRQRREIAALQSQIAQTQAQLRQLAQQRDGARRGTAVPPAVVSSPAPDSALEAEIRVRLARVKQLKQLFAKRPELYRPELAFLNDEAWLDVLKDHKLDDDAGIRSAVLALWRNAKGQFSTLLQLALENFITAHQGLPARASDLVPHFPGPINPAVLERYEMLHTGRADDVPRQALSANTWASVSSIDSSVSRKRESAAVIAEKSDLVVDGEERLLIGLSSMVIVDEHKIEFLRFVGPAQKAAENYAKAHNGEETEDLAQLAPYFDPPLDEANQRRFLKWFDDLKRREARSPFHDLKP